MTALYSLTHGEHIAGGHSHNMHGVLHVLADTVGSVGVITSTLLIRYYGWTGFDPIASLFIAMLIAAFVWPFVQEIGRLLGLDLGDEGERQVRSALGGGRCAGCGWIFRSAFLDADIVRSLRIRPSRLDGVRESAEHVLKIMVIQLGG